jgi:uncharacterized protein YggE
MIKPFVRSLMFLAAGLFAIFGSACSFQPPAATLSGGPVVGSSEPAAQAAVYPFDAIVVTGFGSASAAPDLVSLSLAVSVTEDTVADARETAAEAMIDVRASLKRHRILDSDIATSHFRIHPEYEYGPDGRQQIGYTVSNGLSVTVRNTDQAASVIDDAIAAGGDHLVFNGLNFGFSDTTELEKSAREAAIDDMREKASQLAEFSGRELGDLKVVSDGILGGSEEFAFAAGLVRDDSAGFDTPISSGEVAVTVRTSGVYELK